MADLAVKPDDAARMTLGMTKFLRDRRLRPHDATVRLNNHATVLGGVPFSESLSQPTQRHRGSVLKTCGRCSPNW